MAIHAHSTTAPALQPPLLPLAPFTFRPTPPVDYPRSADELLEEIRRTIEGQEVCPTAGQSPDLPPEPLLLAFHGDTRLDTGSSDRCSLTNHPDDIGVVENRPEKIRLDSARTLHFRRDLHQALDFGFALLDALDLPPLALDVIDDAIATMDAMEAPDEDLEPWLACYQDLAFYAIDAENDDEYLEDDGTAETEPDDEEGGDLEAVDEDGDPLDVGEHDGWRRPRRARVVRTEWPVAMAEREGQRAVVIAAVVTSPNVVRFPGSGPL